MNQIDARGYSCPEPVVMTKNALNRDGLPLSVLVDNMTSVNNITRFAENAGYKVETASEGGDYRLTISQ